MTTQRFVLGSVDWQDERDSTTPYFLSNPRMYLVGSIGGAITPYGDEHLVGKMGGLWAHPMRMMQGWQVRIDGQVLAPATHCTVYPHYVERVHQHAGLQVLVQETLHPNLPLLSVQVQIHNQTAQSWGLARLASSITAGKSAAVDYNILEKGCDHNKKAFLLAKKSRKKYKYGQSKTKKIEMNIHK